MSSSSSEQKKGLKESIFKKAAGKAPRVRGFTRHYYFAHPFLDAWFAWFPLNQIQYNGAALGEVYNAASRIVEAKAIKAGSKNGPKRATG